MLHSIRDGKGENILLGSAYAQYIVYFLLQKFQIMWGDLEGGVITKASIHIDGLKPNSSDALLHGTPGEWMGEIGAWVTPKKVKPFMFSEIELTAGGYTTYTFFVSGINDRIHLRRG